MDKEKLKKMQVNANKKKLDSLPEELKFIVDLSSVKLKQMRKDMIYTTQIAAVIIFAFFFPILRFGLPVVAIFCLYLYFKGFILLKKDNELSKVSNYLKSIPKDEIDSFIKKHQNLRTVHKYKKALKVYLGFGVATIGIVIIFACLIGLS